MAGKRHHIIPKFLMKGFASRIDGKHVFTWEYKKDGKVREDTTNNINVERHFYGKENEENFADEIITNLERDKFSPLLDELRNLEGNVDYKSAEIADFLSNINIRTRNFRNSFYDLSENISQRIGEYFSGKDNLEKILLNQPTFLKSEFEKVWQEKIDPVIQDNIELLKLSGNDLSAIDAEKEKIYQNFVKEFPAQLNKDALELSQQLTEVFSTIKNNLSKTIKDAHNKHLQQKPISKSKIEDYLLLNWFVITVSSPLVLGDAGCIFETIGKRRFRSFEDTNENLINAFLPISTNKLLVGSKYKAMQNIDVKLLNKASAYCSFESFISSENSTVNSKLSASIGIWASFLTDKEIEFYINQIFREAEVTDSLIKSN